MRLIRINPEAPEPQQILEAAVVIRTDGVIAYPTETIYGLGANAFNPIAVSRIFAIKKRDPAKPILIIAPDIDSVRELVSEFPDLAEDLAASFWPGPLTMIFRAAPHIDSQLLGQGAGIGIRVPDNKICLELMKECSAPLTSTSANIAGGANPLTIQQVMDNFGDRIDLYIDGGKSQSGTPSTVLDVSGNMPRLVRKGAIDLQSIKAIIGEFEHETEAQ